MSDDKIVMTERRMNAYYYSFDSVGCDPVDKILSAVACAGKAFHHTSDWYEECDWLGHAGTTPVDWIQNAANEAAAKIERLRADLATQQGCCDGAAAQDAHVRREREEHGAEVDRLRAENERLREALRRIGMPRNKVAFCRDGHEIAVLLARETLEGEP